MDTRQGAARAEILAFAALIALAAIVLWPYRRFAGDDAYISFRFAENLASGHGFAFNPDEPTYGATSPLWIFLLAGARRLGAPIPAAAHALNAACVLLALAAFWLLGQSYLRRPALRWAAAALLVLDPWFVRWSMSGMENALALFLLSSAMLAQLRGRGSASVPWAAPICAGLGLLTRPELAVFTALLLLDTWLFEREARAKKVVAYGLVIALIVLPWLVYAKVHFGTLVPNTVTAKIGAGRPVALLRTLMYFGSFYLFEAAGLAACLALGARRLLEALRDPARRARWFLPVCWAVALPLFYIAGSAPVAGRYLMLGLPAYLLVGVKAWELLLSLAAPRVRPALLVGALVGLSIGLVGFVQYRYCWYLTRWPEGMDPQMIALGRWLKANSEPGEVICTDQIGVVGSLSDRAILDSAGLISPEMQRYNRNADERVIWREIRRHGPAWLIARHDKARLTALDPAYESLDLVGVYEVQREGGGDAGALFRYHLYRTHWRRAR